MARSKWREIFLGQVEQPHRRPQAPAVFRVRRVLEVFLEMNKRARRLNQSLEKIVVGRLGI